MWGEKGIIVRHIKTRAVLLLDTKKKKSVSSKNPGILLASVWEAMWASCTMTKRGKEGLCWAARCMAEKCTVQAKSGDTKGHSKGWSVMSRVWADIFCLLRG